MISCADTRLAGGRVCPHFVDLLRIEVAGDIDQEWRSAGLESIGRSPTGLEPLSGPGPFRSRRVLDRCLQLLPTSNSYSMLLVSLDGPTAHQTDTG